MESFINGLKFGAGWSVGAYLVTLGALHVASWFIQASEEANKEKSNNEVE